MRRTQGFEKFQYDNIKEITHYDKLAIQFKTCCFRILSKLDLRYLLTENCPCEINSAKLNVVTSRL